MRWFALETSSPQASLAMGDDSSCAREIAREGNASILVEPLFRELGADLDACGLCVVGQGPGSYNGLRVGYAFLKGLLCLHPLPVIEVPSTLTLAVQAAESLGAASASLLVLHNARRDELHGTLVRVEGGLPAVQWRLTAPEETLRQRLPAGLDAVVSFDFPGQPPAPLSGFRWLRLFPSASTAARLAHQLRLKPTPSLAALEPHYVRPAVPAT